jgi:hypothetical protein
MVIALAGAFLVPTVVAQNGPLPTLQQPTSPSPGRIVIVPQEPPQAEDEATVDENGLPVIPLKEGLKQLKRIRLKHFGQIRNTEIRQLGIAKLKDYTESKFYPHLLEIFAHEDHDVREAVLDLLMDQRDERADTTIAYGAVFDKDKWFREEAGKRLMKRMDQYRVEQAQQADQPQLQTPDAAKPIGNIPPGLDSGLPWRVKAVIGNGIKQKDDTVANAAAGLAAELHVFDLIPALINAQIQGPTGTAAGIGGGDDQGALAYILVGSQQAFVSDLEPVVGDSAVGFDPQLSVATEGTVLRVVDAAVITYRTEIHYALRRLANAGWDGRRTDDLGFDPHTWKQWYADEFLPYRKAVAEGRVKAGEPLDPH